MVFLYNYTHYIYTYMRINGEIEGGVRNSEGKICPII